MSSPRRRGPILTVIALRAEELERREHDNDGLGVMGHRLRGDDNMKNHAMPLSPQARGEGENYRVNSFIAPSRPSSVSGNMRSENSLRMMVVDSE